MYFAARVILFIATFGLGQASASDHPSHDEVLAAVQRGEIKSLPDIEKSVRDQLPGMVIKVELERKRGVWIYEFKTLDDAGRRAEVYVDARTGAVLRTERK